MSPFINLVALALASGTVSETAPRDSDLTNLSTILPNIPGKQLTVLTVTYLPGTASKPHQHPQSGFIFAYVLSGRIESEVEGFPKRVFGPGESWTEGPGAHHLISRNASSSELAKMLVVIIADPAVPLASPLPPR